MKRVHNMSYAMKGNCRSGYPGCALVLSSVWLLNFATQPPFQLALVSHSNLKLVFFVIHPMCVVWFGVFLSTTVTTTITTIAVATVTSDIRIAFDWITRAMYSRLAVIDWISLVNILHKHIHRNLKEGWCHDASRTRTELSAWCKNARSRKYV